MGLLSILSLHTSWVMIAACKWLLMVLSSKMTSHNLEVDKLVKKTNTPSVSSYVMRRREASRKIHSGSYPASSEFSQIQPFISIYWRSLTVGSSAGSIWPVGSSQPPVAMNSQCKSQVSCTESQVSRTPRLWLALVDVWGSSLVGPVCRLLWLGRCSVWPVGAFRW